MKRKRIKKKSTVNPPKKPKLLSDEVTNDFESQFEQFLEWEKKQEEGLHTTPNISTPQPESLYENYDVKIAREKKQQEQIMKMKELEKKNELLEKKRREEMEKALEMEKKLEEERKKRELEEEKRRKQNPIIFEKNKEWNKLLLSRLKEIVIEKRIKFKVCSQDGKIKESEEIKTDIEVIEKEIMKRESKIKKNGQLDKLERINQLAAKKNRKKKLNTNDENQEDQLVYRRKNTESSYLSFLDKNEKEKVKEKEKEKDMNTVDVHKELDFDDDFDFELEEKPINFDSNKDEELKLFLE